ncbi:MAG: aspartyl protease family protein [Saprospiraceae bacterium]|nr:aspartyl protease family protein [Saprospiraceae bacterium]
MKTRFWIWFQMLIVVAFACATPIILEANHAFHNANTKTIRIPFRYVQSFIILDLQLEHLIPVKLIFDTGAEHTILFEKKWTDVFSNPYQREIKVIGSDLQQELPAWLTTPIAFYFGNIFSVSSPIIVLKENITNISQVIGEPIQGILSASVFKQFLIEIDYKNRFIILHHPDAEPKNNYTKIKIQIYKNKPYLQTEVRSNDTNSQVLNLLLDTGASLSLMMYTDSSSAVVVPDKIIPGYLGSGLGGVLSGFVGKIHSISFDSFLMPGVITHFLKLETKIAKNESLNKDGLIGNLLLDKFNIILDYKKELLYIKALKNYQKILNYDKSGMLLISGGKELESYYVAHIIPGTPAALAGIKEQDQILKVNRLPVSFLSLSSINSILQKEEGKKIRLTIRRNQKKLKFTFYLKSLI